MSKSSMWLLIVSHEALRLPTKAISLWMGSLEATAQNRLKKNFDDLCEWIDLYSLLQIEFATQVS